MAKKKITRRRSSMTNLRPVALNCPFCKNKTNPDYKDVATLEKYLSDRVKILGKARTGICAKHQRRLSREIKRARHLALIPFTPNI
jgi:small subunit ribosomal protein S18